MKKLSFLSYGLAALVIVLDQLSKWWMLAKVFPQACANFVPYPVEPPLQCSMHVAPLFNLSMVWNKGVSFGLLTATVDMVRWGLVFFSLAVAAFLVVWARKVEKPLLASSLGLIIGGAVGNAIDRARFGAVADFLDFKALHFPWVFNVADSAITVGVVILILDSLRSEKRG